VRSSSGLPKKSRTVAVLGVASLLLVGNGENGETASADLIVASVQARYESVRDLRADFIQKSRIASLGRDEEARGRVFVSRPGRMRWEYSAPEPRIITLDGGIVRLYTPSEAQLQIAPLQAGVFSPTALDFLLGDGDLLATFEASRLPDTEQGDVRLALRPREAARFTMLELHVAPKTHKLRGSVVVDLLGNRTEVQFRDLVENGGIAEVNFTIEVPADTEIIDLR
jgi:outer membrane lipoprotein carrier protein